MFNRCGESARIARSGRGEFKGQPLVIGSGNRELCAKRLALRRQI